MIVKALQLLCPWLMHAAFVPPAHARSGLSEELKLVVLVPYLWGVPPTLDCLRCAVVGWSSLVEHGRSEFSGVMWWDPWQ
jgi:hypothetical protein